MEKLTQLAKEIGGIDKGLYFNESHGFTEFYQHYFDEILNRALSEKRKVNILEIGIWRGSSLCLYNEFFGKENCEIYGLDINPQQCMYTEDNVHIFYTNQNSIEELNKTAENFKDIKFDIIIDDGGHTYIQQFNTLLAYHHLVRENGIYILEDLHTNVTNSWGNFQDSPLNYLITNQKSNLITLEQFFELNECISSSTIFKRKNNSCCCSGTSITSILKFK